MIDHILESGMKERPHSRRGLNILQMHQILLLYSTLFQRCFNLSVPVFQPSSQTVC